MVYSKFEVHTTEHIRAKCIDWKCEKKSDLVEVSPGAMIFRYLFCPSCETIYILQLTKYDKKIHQPKESIYDHEDLLVACRKAAEYENRKRQIIARMILEDHDILPKSE